MSSLYETKDFDPRAPYERYEELFPIVTDRGGPGPDRVLVKEAWEPIFRPVFEAVKIVSGATVGIAVGKVVARLGLAAVGVHLAGFDVSAALVEEVLSRALGMVVAAALAGYEFGVCTLHGFGFVPEFNFGEVLGRGVMYCEA